MTCLRSDAVRIERATRRKITHTMDSRGKLVAMFDHPYVFEFVLEALLRGDAYKQAQTLEIERKWGVTNADEWRALNNREPMADGLGKVYTIAGGTEDLSRLGQTYPSGKSKSGSQTKGDQSEDLRSWAGNGSDRELRSWTGHGSGDLNSGESSYGTKSTTFDRNRLYQALESGIPKHHDRSRGGRVDEATTLRDEMSAAAELVMAEALQRVETILLKELDRADNDQDRRESAWSKHAARLQSAIEPACKLWCRFRDDTDPMKQAADIAEHARSTRSLLAGNEVSTLCEFTGSESND